jgi:hypothetical protein
MSQSPKVDPNVDTDISTLDFSADDNSYQLADNSDPIPTLDSAPQEQDQEQDQDQEVLQRVDTLDQQEQEPQQRRSKPSQTTKSDIVGPVPSLAPDFDLVEPQEDDSEEKNSDKLDQSSGQEDETDETDEETDSEMLQRTKLTDQQIRQFPNYAFQTLNKASKPDNLFLHQMHKNWANNFNLLEQNHAYIQWLFPLFEVGMNYQQPPMTQQEADLISRDEFAKKNMITSFHMMLNFWGFQYDENTKVVKRHDNPKQVKVCFDNWMNSHNNLRVTRCMKSFYITGQKEEAFAFFRALHYECSPKGFPAGAGLRMSMDKFWFPIFENDPLFEEECKTLKEESLTWEAPKKSRSWW